MTELGLLMPFGGNQYSKGKSTIKDRAEQIGMSERSYRNRKQILNIDESERPVERNRVCKSKNGYVEAVATDN